MLYAFNMDEMLEDKVRRPVGFTVSKKRSIFDAGNTDVALYVQVKRAPAEAKYENTLKSLILSKGRNLRSRCVGETTIKKNTVFFKDKKFPSIICWKKVPVSKWDSTITMYWVMHTLQKYGIRYQDIRLSNFSIDGLNLLSMTKEDFISIGKEHGGVLYQELRNRLNANKTSNDVTHINKETKTVRKPRKRGQPSKGGSRKSKAKGDSKLIWEFLIELLRDSRNEKLISWKDQKRGIFKFESSGEVARIWGERKKKNSKKSNTMDFGKMSRAMRYHYDSQILMPVEGEQLVYRFGPGLDLSTGKPVEIETPILNANDYSDVSDY